jgi:ligand-binding SRPBCC domain-containing protein
MPMRGPITTSSRLDANSATVWSRITTAEGVNDELRPFLRMTAPSVLREHGLSQAVLGERLCRSWVLLFGALPVDYDDITLERIDPPHSFLERSAMLSQRLWEHERTLEDTPNGCLLTDRIRYEPRMPIPDVLLRTLYARIFAHRHRRLRARFGGHGVTADGRVSRARGVSPER